MFFFQPVQPGQKVIAQLVRVRLLEIFFFDDFQDSFADGADNRISGQERVEMDFADE